MQSLLQLIRCHKSGESVGIYSVCSAHPWALYAEACETEAEGAVL
ncbi:class II D-tagatose-bisphosphate aldolase non-catalytic subunit [Xenorhabdus cabanillasii]